MGRRHTQPSAAASPSRPKRLPPDPRQDSNGPYDQTHIESPSRRRAKLLVAEQPPETLEVDCAGADWPETILIAARPGESPTEFAARVANGIQTVERSCGAVAETLVFTAGTAGDTVAAARRLIARSLMEHAAIAGPAKLTFVVNRRANTTIPPELMHLMESLVNGPHASRVTVCARLSNPRCARP